MYLQPVSYLYFDLEENDHKNTASVIRGSCSLQIGGGSTASVTIIGFEFSCLSVCPLLCIFNVFCTFLLIFVPLFLGGLKSPSVDEIINLFLIFFVKLT